ncbi:hypothetical protein FQN54_007986 [Arachnomyces sp. PD_36]|nr:hypothetical protein FQN54_007986 [Arachnomyces sp. PD_36]
MPNSALSSDVREGDVSIAHPDSESEFLETPNALPEDKKDVEEGKDEDEDEPRENPIVVPSPEQMRNFKLTPRPGELVNGTSYLGNDNPYLEKGDIPKQSSHIYELTSNLEEWGIPSCVVGVWALNFYGAKRVGDDIHLTIPTDLLPSASSRLIATSTYTQVPHTGILYPPNSPIPTYPRLKRQGVNLFIVLLPTIFTFISLPPFSLATPSTITYDDRIIRQKDTNIPFPTLKNLIQSYIDTCNEVDLADIADGLNLPLSWADDEGGLDFSSKRVYRDGKRVLPDRDKRVMWEEAIKGRGQRMGYKYPEEEYVTRFMSRRKWDMILDGQIEMPGYSPKRGENSSDIVHK